MPKTYEVEHDIEKGRYYVLDASDGYALLGTYDQAGDAIAAVEALVSTQREAEDDAGVK